MVISHTATCLCISGACPSAHEHQGDPSVPRVFALADHPKPPAPASCAAPALPANNRCHQCQRLSCPLGSAGISGAMSGPAMALKSQQDLPLQSWARLGVLGAPLVPSSGSAARASSRKHCGDTDPRAVAARAAGRQNKEYGSAVDMADPALKKHLRYFLHHEH